MDKYFDLHVVANVLPESLDRELQGLGYEHKQFIAGDPRVQLNYLLTQKQLSRENADSIYWRTIRAIERYPSFNGYVEEEVVAFDLFFNRPATGLAPDHFPLKLTPVACPEGSYKKCDIHVSTQRGNSEVSKRLVESGFYYQCFDKRTGGRVHVATVQAENLSLGKRVWNQVLSY